VFVLSLRHRVKDFESWKAVFDERLDDARRSFAGARTRARDADASTVEAELGLVVCDWKAGAITEVDGDLAAIVQTLDERAGASDRVASEEDEAASAEREEEALLRSNAGLLFALSLLYGWLVRLPADGGLPPEELEELRRRIERVREADPELGDALLVAGLVEYYFASGETDRSRAVGLLEEGTDKARGIKLPEVLDLIERERRLEEEARDALGRYLTLVRGYLTDTDVPHDVRAELKRRLEEYARYRVLGEIDLTAEEHAAAPSVDDIRHRGTLLRQRIHRLVAPRLRDSAPDDGTTDLQRLLASLDDATKVVAGGVEELQRAERDLMLRTGEFLLPEDSIHEEAATSDA
jgi:hypothetical protein